MSNGLTILLVGDDGSLKAELVHRFRAEGHVVSTLGSLAPREAVLDCELGPDPKLRVVFTPVELNEFTLFDNDAGTGGETLAAAVEIRTKGFLTLTQAALQLLIRAGGGQMWVCDYDDSFAYHMDTPAAPILAQARAGAVRSLAKEYSRMGIAINSLFVQPLADEETVSLFRQAGAGLKSYAMRYKPNTTTDIADMLAPLLASPRLAFSGATVGAGMGVQQGHLTA